MKTTSIPENVLRHRNESWIPITKQLDGSIYSSKFGGIPYLKPGESYPLCQNCQKPMEFIMQLNLAMLPGQLYKKLGSGLLQFFYCMSKKPYCEIDCHAFLPWSKCSLTRVIEIENEEKELNNSYQNQHNYTLINIINPRVIIDWTNETDYPNLEETNLLNNRNDAFPEDEHFETDYPLNGDKLAGYPRWEQGIEYPSCIKCQKPMQFLFQIGSENNVNYMWGDLGTGYITQCETHRNIVTFQWAC